jgi:hypothetical protein
MDLILGKVGIWTFDFDLQATGFVLRPDGTVAVAVYSSTAIGRLVAADTINFLKYLQKMQSPT